jgi:hypothetical protein
VKHLEDQMFLLSLMLLSEAILNSRMDIKLQQRFTPTLGTSAAYNLYFPVALSIPR